MPRSSRRLLSPAIARALERAPSGTNSKGFELGFQAGREYQHDLIRRLLCRHCMNESPVVDEDGMAVHEIQGQARFRVICEAIQIYKFKP